MNDIVFIMWQTSTNEFLQHISSWTNKGAVWAIDLVRGVWLSQLLHMDLHCLHLPTGDNDNDDGDDVEDDHGEVPQSTVGWETWPDHAVLRDIRPSCQNLGI